jgi:spore coat polysaccharide biosynthesis predicted glycosyltransferase SpsG
MNRDPILFRVDGTAQSGWERFSRCMTYAAALQRRRRPTYFLAQLEPAVYLGQSIKRSSSNWLEADGLAGSSEDLEETIQEIRRLRPAAIVVDFPDASKEYLAELVSTGSLVVSMDETANICFPSQLVINPTLGPNRDSYEVLPGTQLLLGSRYALVRSEIRRIRPVRSQEPPLPFRALIALGDDHPNAQAGELAKLLLAMPKLERIDLAVRPQNPAFAPLQELVASHADRLELASEGTEIASRIARCHFAITCGNSWSLELACVGVPQIVIVHEESHWPTAQRLEDEGAAVCLGWHENVTSLALRQAVQNLLADPLERQAMARCGRQLIDGRGPDRLVTALEVLLHPSRLVDFADAA